MGPRTTALVAGLLFGAGLAVSEMTNPQKVLNFLDVTGSWDPTLAFVMGAALTVSAIAVQIDRWKARADGADVPDRASGPARIDLRLGLGAALFGAGWGLAGFCPGPALVALATGSWKVLLFVVSMVSGMALFEHVPRPRGGMGHPAVPTQRAV